MSEYQYYEFQTVDRRLTAEEMAAVGSLSSRTDPTPTRAVFTYSYSDFRGDPEKVLATYYDAMLYLANWGSRQLMFRFPRSVLDAEALAPYCLDDLITTSVSGEYLIVNVNLSEHEGGGMWIEGEGYLSSLVRLRDDLLRGDFRFLYLAWLKAATMRVIDADEWEAYDPDVDETYDYEIGRDTPEPSVPAGLEKLTAPLEDFVDLFEIDGDLVAAAAKASPSALPTRELDVEALLRRLPEAERFQFLVRVARRDSRVRLELMKRLRTLDQEDNPAEPAAASPRRTIGDLLAAAEEHVVLRKEEARRNAEEARLRKLKEMAPVEPQLWDDVFALIEEKKAKPYEQAVALLIDLCDLADHLGETSRFNAQLSAIENKYSTRHGLLRRLKQAGLIKNG